jgi:membrane protein required for colicin V production
MSSLPVNPFDTAVYLCLAVAIIAGFRSGLLRSMATIFGYVAAMPVAVTAAPSLSLFLIDKLKMPQAQSWAVFVGLFLIGGLLLSALLRHTVSEIAGPDVSAPDRMAGAILGALRVGLLAVLIVLIFDRIIPAGREPAFLADSRLRPILSIAAQQGLKSLPPDVADYIDRLKRERGL